MKKTLVKLIATVTTLALVAAAPITAFAKPSLTSSKIKIGSLIQPKKQVIDYNFIFNLADPNKYGDSDGDETTEDAQVAYYNSRVEKLEQMKKEKVNVTMEHHGAYVAKKSILRGAKIVGVRENGEYIVKWEDLDNRSGLCVGNKKTLTLPGNYIGFAYSLDIRWGTDWPYNDTFWYNPESPAKNIKISYGGTCRMVSININVDGTTVVNNSNCSSHK